MERPWSDERWHQPGTLTGAEDSRAAIEADFEAWKVSVTRLRWFAARREPEPGMRYRLTLCAGDPAGLRDALDTFGAKPR
jgi:hypothetical protein